MDELTFWYLIDQSIDLTEELLADKQGLDPIDAQLSTLKKLLSKLSEDELVGFQEIVDYSMDQAYTWSLWGAAYLMMGGLSDDDFEYFRAGLILRGKEVYEGALAEPDSLAEHTEIQLCEDLLFLACEVYEERSGDGAIYDRYREVMNPEPAGEPFDEDDEGYFREHYPRLWQLYSQE